MTAGGHIEIFKSKPYERYAIMVFVAIVGAFLILLADKVPQGVGRSLLQHLGTAAIAAVLGFTIDWWLKKQIAERFVLVFVLVRPTSKDAERNLNQFHAFFALMLKLAEPPSQ